MEENKYWWRDAVIYEVYVDKFAKNFRGMTEKLPYLKDLGINTIWLLPHYPSPMMDDGYDVTDYYNVRDELGTLDDFRSFIKASHDIGVRIIIDLVLNHVSTEHPWFLEASASKNSPKRDYFLWSDDRQRFKGFSTPFSHMTSGNWAFNDKTDDYYYASFFHTQADLNWDNPEVFDEMIRVIDFWVGLGVDGFRLDAISHLFKREGTNCKHLPEVHITLKKIRKHLDDNCPGVILLPETNGTIEILKQYFGNGDECHMIFNFPLMANIYLGVKRKDLALVEQIVKNSLDIPANCQWANFICNHDEISLSALSPEERDETIAWLDPENKFSFPGGSGVSMRLATVFNGDKVKVYEMLKLLASLPGAPVIYYGSEIGMENISLPEVPIDTRLYVRGEFSWKEVEEQAANPNSLLNSSKRLFGERRSRDDSKPKTESFFSDPAPVFSNTSSQVQVAITAEAGTDE